MRAPSLAASVLTGSERYVADVDCDALAATVVRSTMAHARIAGLSGIESARASDGVVDVITGDDVRRDLGDLPRIGVRIGGLGDVSAALQPVLADGVVRYVGEPVAVVVATDRYRAEDSAALIIPELDPLEPVLDPCCAPEVQTIEAGYGDAAAAFAAAPVVVEADISVGRQTGMPIETRGLLAIPEGERVTVFGSAKVLHWNRAELARMLDVPPDRVRYVEGAVGGSFGVRGEFYPEDLLVPFAARRIGKPVRWVEDRWEHFVSTNHGRGQTHRAALAGTEDGRILAFRTEFWADLGAYVRTNGLRVPEVTAGMLPGPYRIEHFAAVGHCVTTTTTPTGTYRGPGRVESTFVRERIIDLYAQRLGLDPIEVRRRNLLRTSDLPLERSTFAAGPQVVIESGDPSRLFERVAAALPTADVQRRVRAGERVGIGLSAFLERSGTGPPFETASVEVDADGRLVMRSGGSSVGQGLAPTLASIGAAELGLDPEQVVVAALDTDELDAGAGSFGSRSTIMAGNALVAAARGLVDAGRPVAAELLGVEQDAVAYAAGEYRDDSGGRVTLAQVSAQVRSDDPGGGARFRHEARFTGSRANSDLGVHGAVVAVDSDTGHVSVEHLVVGFESGPPVSVERVHGQLRGAVAQGVGGAVLEELVYDSDGNPTTTSFVDYLLPTVAEMPSVEFCLDTEPSPLNPLGLRGVGEGGITGVPAAVVSGIADALGDHAAFVAAPVTPDDVHAVLARTGSEAE